MSRRLLGLLFVLVLAVSLLILPRVTSAHELCFPSDKTPHCFSDPFSDYWETNGGLPVFGYPVTTAASEMNADTGQTYLTQWVERTRMEDHPENAGTPYRVLLGLLGKERLRQLGRDAALEPREAGAKAGCLWFEQTGHNVCNIEGNLGFKQYWESHGLKIPGLDAYARSLQLFGLPLTEPKLETNAAGDTVLTQWFERARFEWHPGNPNDYKVLLGLLGREVRDASPSIPPTVVPPPVTPIAPTVPAPTATTAPGGLPPSYNNCQADPNAANAPNYPVAIIRVDKAAETVTIANVATNATVDLTGWRICSIRGNQLHATLSGSLASGETRVIPSQASGLIWSNNDKDDGALYDAGGSLISYWND
jgi:hypothetical protein